MTLPRAIALGGLTIGVLDALDAIVFFGLRNGVPPIRIFQSIASGLLGRSSFQGGLRTAVIGLVIHFSIATTIAAVACLVVRLIPRLVRRPFLAGVVYGIGVWLFMNFVVVPASAAAGGTLTVPVVINGLAIHMVGVGPPAIFLPVLPTVEDPHDARFPSPVTRVSAIVNTLSFVLRHPLNRSRKGAAISRFIRWQLGSRLVPGAVAVPFVDGTRLLVERGMTGATGNVYCGLHEFEDMALVLHALRPGDLFADVGANVGSYTVLAAGAAGATCLSVEPHPAAFAHLVDNLRLNHLESKVTTKNVALGAASGTIAFTSGLDTVNHVVADREVVAHAVEVPVEPLDALLAGAALTLMKIDVEGFETEVLNGAAGAMRSPSLLAVVMELNGSGSRYGYDENAIHIRMIDWGFEPARYDPLQRSVTPLESKNRVAGNTLYVRDLEALRQRVRTAPPHAVLGVPL